MKDFKDKVAVITGAASGIGMELARLCAKEGMKVVIADIDKKRLPRVERRMKREGAAVLAVPTDASQREEIEKLAEITLNTYGAVHLLVNNAAVGNTKYTWNYTLKDWEWQLGVDLLSVIHGIRIFMPIMLKQDNECHIVNVSSMEGLMKGSGPGGAIYGMSKHAIVSLTETLSIELETIEAKLKVSVVCPGYVSSRIHFGDIHRPEKFHNPPEEQTIDTRNQDIYSKLDFNIEEALKESPTISPERAAEIIIKEIKEEKLYILTHKDGFLRGRVKERFDGILAAFDQ
ncbi:MAG: SDR family NAD(P)-dependent oxidoreductase [Promethearchaeota archaeon]|jgi:NAD(P)-dependent dehydrogenase (short-subunit alcohol dehydrogenase family)